MSVVVCSRNRPKLLGEAVASVLHGDQLPDEVVVVDQSDEPHPGMQQEAASGDGRLRYLHTRPPGVSRARNLGARVARNQQIAFIDDDVLVAPAWLGRLVGALERAGPRTVVTGAVLAEAHAGGESFVPSTVSEQDPVTYRGRVDQDVLSSGNMAIRLADLREIGGFDERLGPGTRFPAAEDNDLALRLLDAGYAIQYVPDAEVVHRAWRPAGAYLDLRWRYALGQGAFYAKHLGLNDWYTLTRMQRHFGRLARRTLQRAGSDHRIAWDQVIAMAGLLTGAAQWLLMARRRA